MHYEEVTGLWFFGANDAVTYCGAAENKVRQREEVVQRGFSFSFVVVISRITHFEEITSTKMKRQGQCLTCVVLTECVFLDFNDSRACHGE